MGSMRRRRVRFDRPDGSWIAVDIHGPETQDALVVFPGVMSDAAGWAAFAGALRAWPTVWVVNRRGRAPSGPMAQPHSLGVDVADLSAVLDDAPAGADVFAWSYGALAALMAAQHRPMRSVIAYEPVIAPFGLQALPSLRAARQAGDWDETVVIVNRDISGFPMSYVDALRGDRTAWQGLARLARPLADEIGALGGTDALRELGARAGRVELILGERNAGRSPYGTSFDDVASRIARPRTHVLAGQGHLAHVEAPAELARLVDALHA